MHSLNDVHEMNAYRTGHVCLSICMIQLKNHWTELDGIRYRRYAIGDYHKIVLYNFQQSVIPTWRGEQTCEVRSTLAPLVVGPYSDVW
jgi:hypothetical protein